MTGASARASDGSATKPSRTSDNQGNAPAPFLTRASKRREAAGSEAAQGQDDHVREGKRTTAEPRKALKRQRGLSEAESESDAASVESNIRVNPSYGGDYGA